MAETEIVGQFHGDPMTADLRLYMAGNQFVVMDQLVEAFQARHPEVEEIFYVTIPPGQERNWILQGGIEIHAENSLAPKGFTLSVMPDVYTTVNKGHMDQLEAAGLITQFYTYTHNRLVLMARASDATELPNVTPTADPGVFEIDGLNFYDLMADSGVRISEPDIINQGIERHIWQMYVNVSKAKFPDDESIQDLVPNMFIPENLASDPLTSLRKIVYYDKSCGNIRPDLPPGDQPEPFCFDPATIITLIHHLETPFNLRNDIADVGPVWATEVFYQRNRLDQNDVVAIEITGENAVTGDDFNRGDKVNYLATIVEGVMDPGHKLAAKAWIDFLRSDEAQDI
ncbi:MAG: substrate-binding domain-containing protein, partial [Gammaproteobacteria bacterium]|nr:substrate-binding domain-containing protein [Gammaproteobacteria bacterium]